jgi:hypothetical protein
MIKPFSKNGLRAMNIFFRLSLSRSMIKSATINYIKDVHQNNRFFELSLVDLNYERGDKDFTRLSRLYSQAVNFRSNKKLVKSFLSNILLTLTIVLMVFLPFGIPFFFFCVKLGFFSYLLIYLVTIIAGLLTGFIVMSILEFTENFSIKIGKALTKLLKAGLILLFCSICWLVLDMDEGIFKASFLSVYGIAGLMIGYSIFEYIVSEFLVDAYYYSRKIQITDALIIESSFRLSKVNWSNAVRSKILRQDVIDEIERLSSLIERDWSSHIITGDEKTDRYKTKTLSSIANRFRRFKRSLIIPSNDTPSELENHFKSIFEKILKHDLQSLIDAEVTAERLKKRSKFAGLQSFLVAILPLCTTLIIKNYFPNAVDENILHIGIVISGLWLLISILLWLDPNLADKIATIKSFRDAVRGDKSE